MRAIVGIVVGLVILASGCGGSGMDGKLASYLGDGYEVQGCHDAHFSDGGQELWKCVVNGPGDGADWPEWNVAVRDGEIVDASRA